MLNELSERVGRKKRIHDLFRNDDFPSEGGDPLSEFIVVGEIVDEGFKASNRCKIVAAKRHGGS